MQSKTQVPGPFRIKTCANGEPALGEKKGAMVTWYMQTRSDASAVGGVKKSDWCTRRALGIVKSL